MTTTDYSAFETQIMADLIQKAGEYNGKTAPNPMVGAAVVLGNELVSTGIHTKCGEPHAEVHALRAAGSRAKGATLLVTLEPCTHHGRTPPCTDAIIAAGVRRVIYAASDPNPNVQHASDILESHGIAVLGGLLAAESESLNAVFHFAMTHNRPYVTLKMAMDAAGHTVPPTSSVIPLNSSVIPLTSSVIPDPDRGSPRSSRPENTFTSQESLIAAHKLRREHQAILVGKHTILQDNPRLNVRHGLLTDGYQNPTIIVLASERDIPKDAAIFKQSPQRQVLFLGHMTWDEMARHLFEQHIHSVLIEGGDTVANSALMAKIVNRVAFFITPEDIPGATRPSPLRTLPLIDEYNRPCGPDTHRTGAPDYTAL